MPTIEVNLSSTSLPAPVAHATTEAPSSEPPTVEAVLELLVPNTRIRPGHLGGVASMTPEMV